MTAWSGAVLTGGASRRMGRDKASMPVGGVALAVRAARALEAAGAAEVFCVGGDVRGLGLAAVADQHPGDGPLGGLLTALRSATHDLVVVLSCDLVSPSPDAISRLVDAARLRDADPDPPDAIVPEVGARPQWLHAAWHSGRARHALEAAFESGERSMHGAAATLHVLFVADEHVDAYHDADSPGDLAGGR